MAQENIPQLFARLAALLSASPAPIEPVVAACGTVQHDDGSSVTIAPQDKRWSAIKLVYTPRRDAPAELVFTPAVPVAAAAYHAWFPVYTEVVSKRILPRRFITDLSTPGGSCRVSLIARVERETITELTLLREPRR